jgi:hypothetical protein
MKRILAAGAIALYLQQNTSIVDNIINNPMFAGLGISNNSGMINIEALRDIYKQEVQKVGFMRLHVPLLGDIDFTSEDIDTLYNCIVSINGSTPTTSVASPLVPQGGIS